MSQEKDLLGGLGSDGNEKTAMEKAVFRLSAKNSGRKISQLSSKKIGEAVSQDDGRMSSREMSRHVDELADMVYKFVLETAYPAIWELERDIRDIGEEVLLEKRQGKTRQEQRDEYENLISDLRQFCPENDPDEVLQLEAEIEDQRDLIEAMCLRVKRNAEIAKLVFELAHAETKDDLEDMLNSTREGIDSNVKVFKRSSNKEKAKIWAFGKGYELAPDVFRKYHDFAEGKFAEVIRNRSHELAADNKAKMEQQAKEVLTGDETRVSADELLFGDAHEVNGKTALIFWKFNGFDNAVLVQRSGNQLFLVNAVGKKPKEDLEEMRQEVDGKPFVLLSHILDKDGQHLCPEEVENSTHYNFGGNNLFVQPTALKMTRWARNGAGHCCNQSRLLGNSDKKPNGNDDRKRFTKPLGELLTEQEFFYKGGLGEFDLVYEAGFNHKVTGDSGQPTDEVLKITEPAVARIERKEVEGRTRIVLKSASTQELAILLEKGCGAKLYGKENGFVIVYGEFNEGERFSSLPNALSNGLRLEYGRMKTREAEVAK